MPLHGPSPLAVAVGGLCPRCADRGLFAGWVRFAPTCKSCGLAFERFNVGDGPAAFLILIVGAILCVGAILVDLNLSPPWWVHLVWLPLGLVLTIAGLRAGKGLLIALEYRHRAREGRIAR